MKNIIKLNPRRQDLPLEEPFDPYAETKKSDDWLHLRRNTVVMFFKSKLEHYLRQTNADDETLFAYLSNGLVRTNFFCDDKGNLILNLNIADAMVQMNHELELTTADKVSMLTAINKDNNRIKSLMEENKTTEHKTDSLKPYCDKITSKEKKDGIEWQYWKNGEVTQTAFMTYKKLYEIQIDKTDKCQFCDSRETEWYMPREAETGIYLCDQHEKYIQRVVQRKSGVVEEV